MADQPTTRHSTAGELPGAPNAKGTAKKKSARPGDFVQIPLEDGTYGYAKVLDHEVAFLDLLTHTNEVPLAELVRAPTLFRLWIMQYALKPRSPWTVVGRADLTAEEREDGRYFMQDALSGELRIYHRGEQYPAGYAELPATYDECVGLERAAVWDPQHVESRLVDHFNDRPNVWVESLKLTR